MEYTNCELLPQFKHRYKINADLYSVLSGKFMTVALFLDLGCYNTLIPKYLAKQSGRPLGLMREYRIGGGVIAAEAFSIEKIRVGGVILERVIAFAADFTGEFASDILLGANVMNNWKMVIDKKVGTFQFHENPPDDLPNKINIYQNYFDPVGNYVAALDAEEI